MTGVDYATKLQTAPQKKLFNTIYHVTCDRKETSNCICVSNYELVIRVQWHVDRAQNNLRQDQGKMRPGPLRSLLQFAEVTI